MEELAQTAITFLLQSQYSPIVGLWIFACAAFTAFAPEKWQNKIPDWLMVIINVSALNVGNAKNKLTNLKGNSNAKGS